MCFNVDLGEGAGSGVASAARSRRLWTLATNEWSGFPARETSDRFSNEMSANMSDMSATFSLSNSDRFHSVQSYSNFWPLVPFLVG